MAQTIPSPLWKSSPSCQAGMHLRRNPSPVRSCAQPMTIRPTPKKSCMDLTSAPPPCLAQRLRVGAPGFERRTVTSRRKRGSTVSVSSKVKVILVSALLLGASGVGLAQTTQTFDDVPRSSAYNPYVEEL